MNANAEPPILEAKRLYVSYGSVEVIRDVSLELGVSETLAVIGPNGAGKTTLFRALTGEANCRSGEIVYRGLDVTLEAAHERTRLGMGRTFQVARIFPQFTVRENIVIAIESRLRNEGIRSTRFLQWWPSQCCLHEADRLLSRLNIFDLRTRPAATLSHGDKKRLELAMVLALQPAVLLLDEPTAGMAPADRREIVELICQIRAEEGISILMTEHDMDVIFELAHRVLVLNYGQLVALGTIEEIRKNPTVRDIYLGRESGRAAHN